MMIHFSKGDSAAPLQKGGQTDARETRAAGRPHTTDLTQGPIARGLLLFALPLFLGQLLQQFYNVADAWVIGNFADTEAFAAVSSSGSVLFLTIGFVNGIFTGGGVVISRCCGAGDEQGVKDAVYANLIIALVFSVAVTILSRPLIPLMLQVLNTPPEVYEHSLTYFNVYFAGITTAIMYNACMSILRSLGDSIMPLVYLAVSTAVNILLDLLFVAVFRWGVFGVGFATVLAQGLSALLCIIRMLRGKAVFRLDLREARYVPAIMGAVIRQGLPSGIQNSVISIGNIAIQSSINSFGSAAMAGAGAYSKLEGITFLPITGMSMSLPTFVSQNLGAGKTDRAKKGSFLGILIGALMAEALGILVWAFAPALLKIFVSDPESLAYGTTYMRIICCFFGLVGFTHCAAGVLRGCGRAVIPMATMVIGWCLIRLIYVNAVLKVVHRFEMIGWAYPVTWTISTVVFIIFLIKTDWNRYAGNLSGPRTKEP